MPVNASSQYFDQPTAVAVDAATASSRCRRPASEAPAAGGCGGRVYVDPTTGAEQVLSANSLAVNADNQLYVEPFDAVVVPPRRARRRLAGAPARGGGTAQAPRQARLTRWRR